MEHTGASARADAQDVTQTAQGVTQDAQGVTQDAQGVTQDAQGVTQEAQAHRQDEQEGRQDEQEGRQDDQDMALAAQSLHILAITDGVQHLAEEVSVLNERVYTRNQLDRTRNILICGAMVTFVFLSGVLGLLLVQIRNNGRSEARRAHERSDEAVAARHQLADCTSPPGLRLPDGFVNVGKCYQESAVRTQIYIDGAVGRIEDQMNTVVAGLADAVAGNASLSLDVRRAAAAQAAQLRQATHVGLSPSTTVAAPAARTIPPGPPPSVTRSNPVTNLLCVLLSLLGPRCH